MQKAGLSERRACVLIGLHRSSKRYASRAADDSVLMEEIRKLAN